MNKIKDSLNVNTILLSVSIGLFSWIANGAYRKLDGVIQTVHRIETRQAISDEKIKNLEATVLRVRSTPTNPIKSITPVKP